MMMEMEDDDMVLVAGINDNSNRMAEEEVEEEEAPTKLVDLKELGMDRIEYPRRLLKQRHQQPRFQEGGGGGSGMLTTVGLIVSALYAFLVGSRSSPSSSTPKTNGNGNNRAWWGNSQKGAGGKQQPSSSRSSYSSSWTFSTSTSSSSSTTKTRTTPADDHPLTVQSQTMIQQQGIWKWLTSTEKLPWTIASFLSLMYLVAFVSRVSCDKSSSNRWCWPELLEMTMGLHDGFCIWGSNPRTGICSSRMENSHQYSFYVDAVMVFVTFGVGHYYQFFYGNNNNTTTNNNQKNSKTNNKSNKKKTTTTTGSASRPASFGFTAAVATIIGLHGLLHFGISNGVQCKPPNGPWYHCGLTCPTNNNNPRPPTQPWQWILYGIYNLGLVLLDFGVANFRLPIFLQAVLAIVVTTIFVGLGIYLGEHWALPAVFVQTHVLASITGIFANRYRIGPLVGWWFVAATIVGMTEFLGCESFLLAKGGHVWYDAILHLAMIATLVPRGGGGGAAAADQQ